MRTDLLQFNLILQVGGHWEQQVARTPAAERLQGEAPSSNTISWKLHKVSLTSLLPGVPSWCGGGRDAPDPRHLPPQPPAQDGDRHRVQTRHGEGHYIVIVKSYMFMCLLLDNFEGGLTKTVPWGTFGALFWVSLSPIFVPSSKYLIALRPCCQLIC